jgi:hypothetical protein
MVHINKFITSQNFWGKENKNKNIFGEKTVGGDF